jgi:hypothetical protein
VQRFVELLRGHAHDHDALSPAATAH